MPQQLSSKDASLFRQVVRHYENKQYKKGEFPVAAGLTTLVANLIVHAGGQKADWHAFLFFFSLGELQA